MLRLHQQYFQLLYILYLNIVYNGALEDDKWYFQLKSPNDKIIIQSDGYETEYDCLIAIDVIKHYSENVWFNPVKISLQ